jgi:hypothetical protein
MRGKLRPGKCPDFTMASLWHIPHASTRILTSRGPGSGTGRWTLSNFPPGFETCIARIVDMDFSSMRPNVGRTDARSV